MTTKEIIDTCKHLLHGACGTCIESGLSAVAFDATMRYANGESHICANSKIKPYSEMLCSAGCATKPRTWLRDVAILAGGRLEGWMRAQGDVARVMPRELRAIVLDMEPPTQWDDVV